MASPLPTRKQTVDLARTGPVGSRIRRDPPPKPERKLTKAEIREREAWLMGIGITAFALALFVILVALNIGPGWSPSQVNIVFREG